jgi:hypothetical protein
MEMSTALLCKTGFGLFPPSTLPRDWRIAQKEYTHFAFCYSEARMDVLAQNENKNSHCKLGCFDTARTANGFKAKARPNWQSQNLDA